MFKRIKNLEEKITQMNFQIKVLAGQVDMINSPAKFNQGDRVLFDSGNNYTKKHQVLVEKEKAVIIKDISSRIPREYQIGIIKNDNVVSVLTADEYQLTHIR